MPQAWATATPLSLIQSVLGLTFTFEPPRIALSQPTLPDFLEEIQLRKLVVGDATVDLALCRSGQETAVHVLSRRGNVRVLTAA
jgi:hypothetical protein